MHFPTKRTHQPNVDEQLKMLRLSRLLSMKVQLWWCVSCGASVKWGREEAAVITSYPLLLPLPAGGREKGRGDKEKRV